jgi:chemotaxis protein CheD
VLIAAAGREGLSMGNETFNIPQVLHVVQGQVAVSKDPRVTFTAVLGTCVAVCLFDPQMKLGGMAHFMFPDGKDYALNETRFCRQAIASLIAQIGGLGGMPNRLQAKLFGAALSHNGPHCIGRRNAVAALEILQTQGITLKLNGLGGDHVRRIWFSPTSGLCTERAMHDGLPHEAFA